jgi:MOSC domain-containing protein YiiM
VQWISLRPVKRAPLASVDTARALTGGGLEGDHDGGRSCGRGVTLVQAEHLGVTASLTGVEEIAPAMLRRNLVVSGIDLVAPEGPVLSCRRRRAARYGLAHPCSRMEEALGSSAYNVMRGYGGLCARILEGGILRVGDVAAVERAKRRARLVVCAAAALTGRIACGQPC